MLAQRNNDRDRDGIFEGRGLEVESGGYRGVTFLKSIMLGSTQDFVGQLCAIAALERLVHWAADEYK